MCILPEISVSLTCEWHLESGLRYTTRLLMLYIFYCRNHQLNTNMNDPKIFVILVAPCCGSSFLVI